MPLVGSLSGAAARSIGRSGVDRGALGELVSRAFATAWVLGLALVRLGLLGLLRLGLLGLLRLRLRLLRLLGLRLVRLVCRRGRWIVPDLEGDELPLGDLAGGAQVGDCASLFVTRVVDGLDLGLEALVVKCVLDLVDGFADVRRLLDLDGVGGRVVTGRVGVVGPGAPAGRREGSGRGRSRRTAASASGAPLLPRPAPRRPRSWSPASSRWVAAWQRSPAPGQGSGRALRRRCGARHRAARCRGRRRPGSALDQTRVIAATPPPTSTTRVTTTSGGPEPVAAATGAARAGRCTPRSPSP